MELRSILLRNNSINQNRAVLGGLPITAVHATDLKIGLTPPAIILQGDSVNTTMLERDIQSLIDIMAAQNREHIARADEGLRSLLKIICSDTHMLHALSRLRLTEMGLTLIDETGACPLCDTSWPPGKLQEHLEHRIETAKSAADLLGRIKSLSTTMSDPINASIVNIQKVIAVVQVAHLGNEVQQLQSWLANLQYLSDTLNSVIDNYPDSHAGSFDQILAPNNVADLLGHIQTEIKVKYPEATPEQTAWDMLTRLEENIKALEGAEDNYKGAIRSHTRSVVLLDGFQKARDAILGKLFDEIKEHFVTLYRYLHGPDEDTFTAILHPDGAALNFEVDFYGRGTHPPHALHSEGHQDSMGLGCRKF